MLFMPSIIRLVVSVTSSTILEYPASPRKLRTAHAPATGPPDFVLMIVELISAYVVDDAHAKIWYRRNSLFRYMTTLAPLALYPYLCMSAEIDVTPGTV